MLAKRKKNIVLLTCVTFFVMGVFLVYQIFTAFDPQLEHREIHQRIGGTLICHSIYYPDIHTSSRNISYQYRIGDELIDLGNGSYYYQPWSEDEQLVKWNDLIILTTGARFGEKINVYNRKTGILYEYEFTGDEIEKEELWKIMKVPSLLNYCCAEIFIEKIEKDKLVLSYKFRTSETKTDQYGIRKIHYQLDRETGKPKMVEVKM